MRAIRNIPVLPQWHPPGPAPVDANKLTDLEQQKFTDQRSIKDAMQKAISSYFAVWAFCILSVSSSPDVLLVVSDSSIQVPIIGSQLSLISFIIVSVRGAKVRANFRIAGRLAARKPQKCSVWG